MPSVFDGMAGVLDDVFGAPVMIYPAGGGQLVGRGIFRETPVSAADEDGHAVLVTSPTLRMRKPDATVLRVGDLIKPECDDRMFRVLNRWANGSPARDAFVVFELEDAE